jgi:hypothetical protein
MWARSGDREPQIGANVRSTPGNRGRLKNRATARAGLPSGVTEPRNSAGVRRRSPHSVRILVHAWESLERNAGSSQRTHSGVDVVDEPSGVRASRFRHLRHDRESEGRAARIDDDRVLILVAQRQPGTSQ